MAATHVSALETASSSSSPTARHDPGRPVRPTEPRGKPETPDVPSDGTVRGQPPACLRDVHVVDQSTTQNLRAKEMLQLMHNTTKN